jgi:hypothetical protein
LIQESKEKGYEEFVSFFSKTKLIEHYEKSLGAVHVGGHRMVICTFTVEKLIQNKMGYIKQHKGIYFVVEPHNLTKKIISKIIADYKAHKQNNPYAKSQKKYMFPTKGKALMNIPSLSCAPTN